MLTTTGWFATAARRAPRSRSGTVSYPAMAAATFLPLEAHLPALPLPPEEKGYAARAATPADAAAYSSASVG